MKNGIWVELKILLKEEVLDVQGRAIVQTLEQNKQPIIDCRYGKCIRILLDVEDATQAQDKARKLAEYILYNPLTETCEVKVMSS